MGQGDAKRLFVDKLAKLGKWLVGLPCDEAWAGEMLFGHVQKAEAHPSRVANYFVLTEGAGRRNMRCRANGTCRGLWEENAGWVNRGADCFEITDDLAMNAATSD